MNKGEMDKAIRRALTIFDEWNDVTGVFEVGSGYWAEIMGVIEDAVHCGAQQALNDIHKLDSENVTTE
jgi:hypothetical protein